MRNRGMFGYEGEGFLEAPEHRAGFSRDFDTGTDRGWNIGRGSDRPSYRGRGPKNWQRSDERIREEVCERLTMDHDVDASDIEVLVEGAVVTLNGSVEDRRAKRLAEDISDSVGGVRDVRNNLRVARERET